MVLISYGYAALGDRIASNDLAHRLYMRLSDMQLPVENTVGREDLVRRFPSNKGLYQKSKTLSAFLRERLALIEGAGTRRVTINSLARRLKVCQ
jgi:hypothetical protein